MMMGPLKNLSMKESIVIFNDILHNLSTSLVEYVIEAYVVVKLLDMPCQSLNS